MAPRRGGSYGGDSYSYSNPSVFLQKSRLYGSGFTDGYAIAQVVFTAIYLAAFIGIAIWNVLVKKRGEVTRYVLRTKFAFAMLFVLVSYAFGFIQLILAEENTVVVNVYYIISVIITDLFYLANILLLVTIFALVFHFFSPSNDEGKATKKKILWAHYAFCAILLAMFCALLGMSLYRVITSINRYGEPYLYSGRTAITQSYYKLDVAFDSLLFVASFEILLGSAWLIPRSRAKQLSIKPAIFLLTLVAIPYFIRRTIILAFDARFELGRYYITAGALLAETIITDACLVIVFAGIVMSATKLDKTRTVLWNGGQPTNQMVPAPYSGGQPMQGYQNGYMPAPGGYAPTAPGQWQYPYAPGQGQDPYNPAPTPNGMPQGYAHGPQMQQTPSNGYSMSQQTQSTHYEVTGQHGAPTDMSAHGQAVQHK